MKFKLLIILFIFIFSFGCLQLVEDLEEAQFLVIQENLNVLKNQDCSCFVCTQSTGGFISDTFTYNDLASGGCYIKENCSAIFLAEFQQGKYNFLRTFDIGMGNTFFEYEEANLLSSIGLGIVFRELKEHDLPKSKSYILPIYEGDTELVRTPLLATTFFDRGKIPALRALEKNALPIYYINSHHLTVSWLEDFFKETSIGNTPSFIAVKSSAKNVDDLIKNINSKCTDEGKTVSIEGKCVRTEERPKTVIIHGEPVTTYVEECVEYEQIDLMQYGCKSMLYVDYIVNSSDVNYTVIFNQINEISEENRKGINSFLIHMNITEDDACHAPMVAIQAMNLSRTLMRTYGTKPSYLVVSIDDYCKENHEHQMAQALFSSIYYMRMTGLMGMIYYDYLPSSNEIAGNVEKPKTFLQLNNYYYNFTYGYNREPLLFDSDGINISKVCDTRSQMKTLTINMEEVDKIDLVRLNPDPSKLDALDDSGETGWYYIYSLPMLDYGKWTKIIDFTTVFDDESDDTGFWGTKCDYTSHSYRKVHLDAEKCGVSNYLLLSFEKNNVNFDCDEWYDMIDGFVLKNEITVNDVQSLNSNIMRQLAFAYTMGSGKEILTDAEMRTYCYGSFDEPGTNPRPCDVVNDYVDIRDYFLEYLFYPTCWSYRIGYNHN